MNALEKANWSLIPAHCRDGLIGYIMHGHEPGDFLRAVLENDLKGAVSRADAANRASIANYVAFLYNYAPTPCWGSAERVHAWIASRGLRGQSKAAAEPELSAA